MPIQEGLNLPKDLGKIARTDSGEIEVFLDETLWVYDGESGDSPDNYQVRQNIDPYPLAFEVKLLWDRQERVGMIVPPSSHDDVPGEVINLRVGKGEDSYPTVAIVSPYGEIMQAVFWAGEDALGFWSPEYLLPRDFDFQKRPDVTIARHSMYVIKKYDGLVLEEGFMYINDDDPEAGTGEEMMPF